MSGETGPRRRTRTGSKDDLSLMLPPAGSQGWVSQAPRPLHNITPRPSSALSVSSLPSRGPTRSHIKHRRTLIDGMVGPPPDRVDADRDPALLKRQRVLDELLDTEKRFVTVLDVLESEFRVPLLQRHLLSGEQVEQLFANVHDIRRLHKSFLLRLLLLATPSSPAPFHSSDVDKRLFRHCMDLPSLFQEYARQAFIVTVYCKAHALAQSNQLLPTWLQKHSSFADFVKKQLMIPQANRQTLQSLLATIPQRVCKYPLLLKEYLKSYPENDPQRDGIASALECMNRLLDEIDQDTGPIMTDFVQLKKIAVRLKISKKMKFNLLEDGRAFIHEGEFEVLKPQAYGSYGFLCSDVLLLTKPLRPDVYKVTRILSLSSLILCAPLLQEPSTPHDVVEKPLLQMAEVGRGIFKVQFPSHQAHDTWVHVLHKQLNPAALRPPTVSLRDGSQTSRPTYPVPKPSIPMLDLPASQGSVRPPSDLSFIKLKLDEERERRKEAELRIKELEAAVKSLKRRVAQQNKIILDLSTIQSPDREGLNARARTTPHTPDEYSPHQSDEATEERTSRTTHPTQVLQAVRDRLVEVAHSAPREPVTVGDACIPSPALRTRSEDIVNLYAENSHSFSDSEEVSVRENFSSRAYKQSQANRKTVLIHRASQPTLIRAAHPTLEAPSSPSHSEDETRESSPTLATPVRRRIQKRGRTGSGAKARTHTPPRHEKYLNSL